MKTDIPDSDTARNLAAAAIGSEPVEIRRFKTGSRHYVFEALFKNRAPVVIRMAVRQDRKAMAGAKTLSRLLRPLGVLLPEILAEGLDNEFPYLILERLPGVDLGEVIGDLPDSSLQTIATKVATAQSVVSKLPSVGRYGYGVKARDAPHRQWHHVLNDNLNRSRKRIKSAGLFDTSPVDRIMTLVMAAQAELDSMPSTPFLHDTTTKNVIVTLEGTFSGIVDVDDLCFGDPRYVVALTRAALMVSSGPVDYVDAWMKVANYRDDHIFRLYVALFIVDFMSEHGQVFNDNRARSSAENRRRLIQVFAECLKRL